MALSGTVFFYGILLASFVVLGVEAESGLGMSLAYWLFIGASQMLYLLPLIGISLLRGHPGVAWGLVQGGGIVATANVLAWALGMWIGAR